MNKLLLTKLLTLAFVGFFQTAEAATLNIKFANNASLYTVGVGSIFDAQIYAEGLADFAGFDFTLNYSDAKLSALSLTTASVFGAETDESFANSIGPSSIHFAEALSASALTTKSITAPTLLGTVRFQALATTALGATAAINLFNPAIYTFDGTSLAGTLQNGAVVIDTSVPTQPPAAVPLPAASLLFGSALLSLFGIRRKLAVKG